MLEGLVDDLLDIEAGCSLPRFVMVRLLLDLYQMEDS
jgi:hypothetical protein